MIPGRPQCSWAAEASKQSPTDSGTTEVNTAIQPSRSTECGGFLRDNQHLRLHTTC